MDFVRLTSSFPNLADGLLYRHPRRPSDNLLALKLVILILEAINSVSEEEEGALEQTEGGTEANDGSEALDCVGVSTH